MDSSEEERRLVEEAMAAADSGQAGHWPTVAAYLADEVKRQRVIVAAQLAKVAAYEAGMADLDAVEGAVHVPATLWRKLLRAPLTQRMSILARALEADAQARRCLTLNHEGHIGELLDSLEDTQRKLCAAFGFETPQSLYSLTVAVQALRNIMVAGISERGTVAVEYAEATPDYRQPQSVQDQMDEMVKSAGIDTSDLCRYEWATDDQEDVLCSDHVCDVVNPLHSGNHECEQCNVTLSHEAAERIEEAKRNA